MSDIKSLHKTARTLILNLRDGLEQLERSENVGDLTAILVKAEGLLLAQLAASAACRACLVHRHLTMALPQACLVNYSRSCRTCRRSVRRWKASGVCKLSRRARLRGTFGKGVLLSEASSHHGVISCQQRVLAERWNKFQRRRTPCAWHLISTQVGRTGELLADRHLAHQR